MIQLFLAYKKISNALRLPIVLIVLASCDAHHFEYPLPTDEKNIYNFPKSLQGKWYEHGNLALIIQKKSISLINDKFEPLAIYNGFIDSSRVKKEKYSLGQIWFNKMKNRADTIRHFVAKDDKIYRLKSGGLEFGRKFKLKGDTLYTNVDSTDYKFEFKLGEDNFLRKLTADQYVLNMREGNLMSGILNEHQGIWFQIYLLKADKDGSLQISIPENAPNSFTIYRIKYDQYDIHTYLNCRWTRDQMMRGIETNFFRLEKLEKK
jgi:hypothetical protein